MWMWSLGATNSCASIFQGILLLHNVLGFYVTLYLPIFLWNQHFIYTFAYFPIHSTSSKETKYPGVNYCPILNQGHSSRGESFFIINLSCEIQPNSMQTLQQIFLANEYWNPDDFVFTLYGFKILLELHLFSFQTSIQHSHAVNIGGGMMKPLPWRLRTAAQTGLQPLVVDTQHG